MPKIRYEMKGSRVGVVGGQLGVSVFSAKIISFCPARRLGSFYFHAFYYLERHVSYYKNHLQYNFFTDDAFSLHISWALQYSTIYTYGVDIMEVKSL